MKRLGGYLAGGLAAGGIVAAVLVGSAAHHPQVQLVTPAAQQVPVVTATTAGPSVVKAVAKPAPKPVAKPKPAAVVAHPAAKVVTHVRSKVTSHTVRRATVSAAPADTTPTEAPIPPTDFGNIDPQTPPPPSP